MDGATGPAGADGATGPQGPPGPVGPASGDGARTIVDWNGTAIGVIELSSGLVTRKIGDDVVLLPVVPGGFYQGDITFFHTSSDCSSPRYLANNGGSFAYYAQMSAGKVFYTRLSDPSLPTLTESVESYEVVKAGDDPTAPGVCTQASYGFVSVGAVVVATDPALGAFVTPFHLQ